MAVIFCHAAATAHRALIVVEPSLHKPGNNPKHADFSCSEVHDLLFTGPREAVSLNSCDSFYNVLAATPANPLMTATHMAPSAGAVFILVFSCGTTPDAWLVYTSPTQNL
jgi:hypothetical protein